jgi:hypothetical protein
MTDIARSQIEPERAAPRKLPSRARLEFMSAAARRRSARSVDASGPIDDVPPCVMRSSRSCEPVRARNSDAAGSLPMTACPDDTAGDGTPSRVFGQAPDISACQDDAFGSSRWSATRP